MIDFKNGLDYDDLLQIFKAINPILMSPELRSDLQNGANSTLVVLTTLQNFRPLLGIIPGLANLGGHLDSGVRMVQLMKGLLDA